MQDIPFDDSAIEEIARPIADMLIKRYEERLSMVSDEVADSFPAMPQFKIELYDDAEDLPENFLEHLEEEIHRELEEYYQPVILH